MLNMLIGFGILVLCFFISSYFRLKNKEYGSDEYSHLMMADLVRKNRFRIPYTQPWILIPKNEKPEPFDYPPLFTYFLCILPKKIRVNYRRFISPFINTVICALLMIVTFLITKNSSVALIAGALYSITPCAFHQTFNLNPRVFANLLFNLTILAMWMFLQTLSNLYLALTILLFALVMLTHKLATQALVFTFIMLSIFYQNLYFLLVIISAVLLSLILTRGFYIKILKGHIAIVSFWSRHLNDFTVSAFYGGSLKHRFVGFVKRFSLNLWLLFVPFIITSVPLYLQYFVYVAVALFIDTLLTSTKIFGGFGDYAKYYDYGLFSLLIPLSYYLYYMQSVYVLLSVAIVILLNLFAVYSMFKQASNVNKEAMSTKYLDELVEFLRKRKEQNLFFIPTTDEVRTIRYNLEKKFPSPESPTRFDQTVNDGVYFRVTKDLKTAVKKYRIEMILINNDVIKDYDLSFCKKVFSNKKYSAFKV